MTALVIQTALLLAIAFILGAIIGCILKRIFADDSRSASAGTAAATAAVATAATAAAVRAEPAPAPVAAKEPDVAPAVLPGHATSASGPVAAAMPAPAVSAPAAPLMAASPAAAAEKPAKPKAEAKPAAPKVAPAAKPAAKSEAKAKPAATKAAPAAKPAKAEAKPMAVAAVKAKPAPKPAPSAKPEAKAEAKPKAAARPKPAAKPAAKAKPAAAAPAKDDLKLIKGIGRQNEARLNAVGVSAFAQIAGWSAKDQREMGERLAFPGRIEREEWVAQAKILAKGGKTDFAKRVAKGEVASSTGRGSVGELGAKPKKLIKAARKGKPDNLTLVNGIGNAIEKKLFELGVFHFDQIAGWTQAEAAWVSNAVGFPGRAARENWMEDAAKLASGVVTEHAKRVEEGAIPTSRKSTAAEKRAAAPKGKKGS